MAYLEDFEVAIAEARLASAEGRTEDAFLNALLAIAYGSVIDESRLRAPVVKPIKKRGAMRGVHPERAEDPALLVHLDECVDCGGNVEPPLPNLLS